MKVRSIAALSATAALMLAVAPASADPVNISSEGLDINGQGVAPGSHTYKTDVTVTAGPTLTATLTAFGAPPNGNGIDASMTASQSYQFSLHALGVSGLTFANGYGITSGSVIRGTPADFSIPLLFTYGGTTSKTGDSYLDASVSVYDGLGQYIGGGQANCGNGHNGCGDFGASRQPVSFTFLHYNGGALDDPASYVYTTRGSIDLQANLHASAFYDTMDAVAFARVDPTLEFAPGFLAAHPDATLSFSSVPFFGVGAVPEPATWAMMIMGFGLIGTALRVSKRRRGTALSLQSAG